MSVFGRCNGRRSGRTREFAAQAIATCRAPATMNRSFSSSSAGRNGMSHVATEEQNGARSRRMHVVPCHAMPCHAMRWCVFRCAFHPTPQIERWRLRLRAAIAAHGCTASVGCTAGNPMQALSTTAAGRNAKRLPEGLRTLNHSVHMQLRLLIGIDMLRIAVISTPGARISTAGAIIRTPSAIICTPGAIIRTPSSIISTPCAIIRTPSAIYRTPWCDYQYPWCDYRYPMVRLSVQSVLWPQSHLRCRCCCTRARASGMRARACAALGTAR